MISLTAEGNRRCCCGGLQIAESPPLVPRRKAPLGRRALELAGWLIPSTLLAFFPKCPLCVAGYVALATGLGLSLTAATYLRWALLVLCVGSLALLALRFAVRTLRRVA